MRGRPAAGLSGSAVAGTCGALAGTLALVLAPASGAKPSEVSISVKRETGRVVIGGLGRGTLAESAATPAGPGGRIGFLAAGAWYHATALERRSGSERRPKLVLSTDDPAGRTIELRGKARDSGIVDLRARVAGGSIADVAAVGIGFGADPSERYLGFGERSNAVDQRGNEVENYVGEGPHVPADYPLFNTQVPPWGIRERADATYFPMPWLISTGGYGALVSNYETSRFRLGTEVAGEWSVEVDAAELRLRIFAGPDPADVVRRMTAAVGRQPEPFAPWQLGPWAQTGHQNTEPDELAHLDELRAADAPLSAVETHMRYMPCGSDQGQETAERARTAAFHARGLAALTYTREAICETYPAAYDRAITANAFLRRPDGTPYTFPAFVGSGQTNVGMLDFSNPAAREIYASVLDRAYANGYDGWMEDYGEYAPPDSRRRQRHDRGRDAQLLPRPLPPRRLPLRARQGPSGDPLRALGLDRGAPLRADRLGRRPVHGLGLRRARSAVTEALTMGLSGISSWGSDIGGFFTFASPPLTEELLIRWIQFGAVSGVMRTKAEGIGIAQDSRPQVWEQPVLEIWRRYAKLRTQLYPYLVAADDQYQRTGLPIMRHLALAYPRDRRAIDGDHQFLFGPDLLAAPVTDPGQTRRKVYLPEGSWIDFWRSVSYDRRSGELNLAKPLVRDGGAAREVAAPLAELPLLARSGTILPLLPAGVDTLSGYGKGAPGVTRLRDRRDRLHLLAFPRLRSSARFYEDGELTSIEGEGRWTLRIDSQRERRFEIEASLAAMRHPFVPTRVLVDGEPIPRGTWGYDRATGAIELSVRARRAEIVVAGR